MQNKFNWQKIYLDYSPKLLGICRRYIQDIYEAEDIVQDSFIVAMQKDHQLKDEKALFAWLKKIVVNNALQYIRSNSKDTFVTIESSEIPDTYSEMEHYSLEEKNIFIYDFTNEELLASIDSLPSHHKSVFNLYFIDHHSHAEISSLLGITVNTSKSHLLRAKKAVKNYLLNSAVNQNTPKKKTAQLLVFFGLGGLLWAQTFQSKFSDFTISPSKNLDIPSDILKGNLSFSSNQAWKKKTVIALTILIIITVLILFLNPNNSFFNNENQNISSGLIKDDQKKTAENKDKENRKKSDFSPKDLSSVQNLNQADNKQKIIPANQEIPEEKTLKKKKNTHKIILKDSINETPQKVIVVKKVIKRDTIFIER